LKVQSKHAFGGAVVVIAVAETDCAGTMETAFVLQ